MSQINLDHLKYFIDAAKHQSVGHAARMNNVSQPTVSQGIRRLEQSLGVELLSHQKNIFQLTEHGKLVSQRSKSIFEAIDLLKHSLVDEGSQKGVLSIGAVDSLASHMLPVALREFMREHSQIVPEVHIGAVADLARWIEEGKIEFALVVDDGKEFPFLKKTVLKKGTFNSLKGKSLKAAPADHCLMTTDERPGMKDLRRLLPRKQKHPLILMRIESWEAIVRMAKAGVGTGVVPDFVANKADGCEDDKIFADLTSRMSYKIVLLQHRRSELSRKAQSLFEKCRSFS